MQIPDTIQAIFQQIGRGLSGGLVYVGASNYRFLCPEQHGECRPRFASEFNAETGAMKFDVGLVFNVNGKRGARWEMFVTYEQDDTYKVRLIGKVKNRRAILDEREDVYCDSVQQVVESMYDNAIKAHNNGVINLG